MHVTIKSKISASKFYHDAWKDYYHEFNDKEKTELKYYILSEDFRDEMMIYLKASCTYHGSVKIQDISYVESDNDNELSIVLNFFTDNVDNYTANKIINILYENFLHYYRSSSIYYGEDYYYSVDDNVDDNVDNLGTCVGLLVDDDDDDDDDGDKNKNTQLNQHKIYLYQNPIKNTEHINIRHNKYHFNMWVAKTDILINDSDYWNNIGTEKTNFVRDCHNNCKYYCYVYENKTMENLIESTCNNDNDASPTDIMNDILSNHHQCNDDTGVYVYVTDKNHNILCENR